MIAREMGRAGRLRTVCIVVGGGLCLLACKDAEEPVDPLEAQGLEPIGPGDGEVPQPPGDERPSPERDAERSSEEDSVPSEGDIEGTEADPPPRGETPLGGRCSRDQDCESGLSCFVDMGTSTSGRVSIAGGYCSVPCGSDDDCASQGEGSYCYEGVLGGGIAFCLQPCQGTAPPQEKCLGRSDMVCGARPGGTGACRPNCGVHADCEPGVCEYSTGQCLPGLQLQATTSIGTVCELDGEFTCEGFCYGDRDRDSLCSHGCRVGSPCGGGDEFVCVPRTEGLRLGDQGLCELRCEASGDCVEGLSECAPTGFRLPSGVREAGCWLSVAGGASVDQRLSVEEMAVAAVPEPVLAVRSWPLGGGEEGLAHELSADEEGVCVRGTFPSEPSQLALLYLFGTVDGVPFDASTFQGVDLSVTTTHTVLLEALESERPDAYHIRRFSAEVPVIASLMNGEQLVEWSAFAIDDEAGPSFDPAQLEALRLRLLGEPEEAFELCVGNLELSL